jgi:sodium/bile acid cotransporter 7
MPTTLSSGAVLVDQSNGNFTLALLLTAGTNVMGIFTIPFMLKLYLSTGTDVEISPVPMLIKLCITILLPLCLGKALRQIQPLVDFRLR